jgi:hypothetical protein
MTCCANSLAVVTLDLTHVKEIAARVLSNSNFVRNGRRSLATLEDSQGHATKILLEPGHQR